MIKNGFYINFKEIFKSKKMSIKSFLNFFLLNGSIIYLTNTKDDESPTEAAFKILLYSYFIRAIMNLFGSDFLVKIFHHHEHSIFSCSNVLFLITH